MPAGAGAGASSAAAAAPQSKKPADTDFSQQRMRAWQPILTPKWVIITFALVGILFVIIGAVLRSANDSVVEYVAQYDGAGTPSTQYLLCHIDTGRSPSTCTVSLTVTKEMKGPVFVYYELANFYQNHRRYVKSRSDAQLAGTVYTDESKLTDCDPLRTLNGSILHPCGLIAMSYFNDTFSLSARNTGGPVVVNMSETDISWSSDRSRKFKAIPLAERAQYGSRITWINQVFPDVADVTNEHFIVWMRAAALPTFRKLYGRIDGTIAAGTTLDFTVTANYPVTGFDGKKSLVVSTTSFMGGKNDFLGIAYIVVGAVCLGLAVLFLIRQFFGGRRLGDTSFLVWQTRR